MIQKMINFDNVTKENRTQIGHNSWSAMSNINNSGSGETNSLLNP